jgi:hypothetical protein
MNDLEFRAEARVAGWKLDKDDLWSRDRVRKDKVLRGVDYFGFTTEKKGELGKVYVRSAIYALAYDKGVVTKEKKR